MYLKFLTRYELNVELEREMVKFHNNNSKLNRVRLECVRIEIAVRELIVEDLQAEVETYQVARDALKEHMRLMMKRSTVDMWYPIRELEEFEDSHNPKNFWSNEESKIYMEEVNHHKGKSK